MAIQPFKSRIAKGTAAGALVLTMLSGFEGVRLVAYRDPVGIPTACFGETRNIHMGDRFTMQQCKDMLGDSAMEFERGVRSCLLYPDKVPIGAYVASISFAYNLGVGAYCRSSIVTLLNKGQYVAACDRFSLYNKATIPGTKIKIVLPGLTTRRAEERAVCRGEVI